MNKSKIIHNNPNLLQMKKFFTNLLSCCLVATSLGFAHFAEAAPFELEYNFDDDAKFPQGVDLPEGWAESGNTGFLRRAADYFGFYAKSGDYVLGKSGAAPGDVLFTPMMKLKGGEPCTISFNYIAPDGGLYVYSYGLDVKAGSAQNVEAQTITVGSVEREGYPEWKEFSFTFTPDADGEYCFSITVTTYLPTGSGKGIAFDDIFINGEEPDEGGSPVEPSEPVDGVDFEMEFTFDEDADYPGGATFPEGWGNDGGMFQRALASDFGLVANSGDYVLGKASVSPEVVLYTPMVNLVGGAKCTLELDFIAPASLYVRSNGFEVKAGNSQNVSDHTYKCGSVSADSHNDWEKHVFEFTPDADGEYCFSITFTNGPVGPSGEAVAFDDVFITGKHPKSDTPAPLEPNADNLADCMDLPYIETFSDPTHYDGTSQLPIGWHSTGTTVWVTANIRNDLPAIEGDYYMVTPRSEYERDAKAYTPFFNLEAGTEYTISFYTMIEGGWDDDGDLHLPTLEFRVGTEQDYEFHRTLLSFDNQHTSWVKRETAFKPEISGPYCFAFALSGEANTGMAAIEYLQITAPGLQARVEPGFAPIGIFDLYTSNMLAFEGKPVKFANTSRYADSYVWSLTFDGEEVAATTESNPSFVFDTSGEYKLSLSATNSRGTRSTTKTFEVIVVSDDDSDPGLAVSLLNERSDMIADRGNIPCFDTAPDADFITGYNHYYHKLAQLFSFPAGTETWVSQVSFWVTDRYYRNAAVTYGDDRDKPFSIVLYGAKEDGSLDPETVFGRFDTTIGEAMGKIGLGSISGDPRFVNFPKPVKTTGPVFVAMEFDASMTIDAEDPNLGRSYISTSCIKFGHGQGNLHVQPFAVPEGCIVPTDGSWCKLGDLDSSKAAYGANWQLWLSTRDPQESGLTAVNPDGDTVFAVCLDNAGNIVVSGTSEGETVTVHNVAGVLVASAIAADNSTTVRASHLGNGIYIVKAAAGSVKIAK